MKFNIRKKNFNIMTQKTSVMTSPHHMTRWWKWRVHYSDLSVSFSWLIISGNEGITVEGVTPKRPLLLVAGSKKNTGLNRAFTSLLTEVFKSDPEWGVPRRRHTIAFQFPVWLFWWFVKVASCHRVIFCHLHALNRMKGTAKIKMGFMLKLMQY